MAKKIVDVVLPDLETSRDGNNGGVGTVLVKNRYGGIHRMTVELAKSRIHERVELNNGSEAPLFEVIEGHELLA